MNNKNAIRKLLLFTITFIGIIVLIIIDQWQLKQWHISKNNELEITSQLYKNRFEETISSRFNAIESLAALFALNPETTSKEFAYFSSLLLKNNPPIRAIQYADSKTRVTYVYPPKGNEITISDPMVLLSDPKRGPYTQKAIDQRKASLQGPFDLRQGGMGVVVRTPIFQSKKFVGLAIGIYNVEDLVNEALRGIDHNKINFILANSSGEIFLGEYNSDKYYQKQTVYVADTNWAISLAWKENSFPRIARMLIWFLGCAFIISIVLLLRTSFGQTIRLEKTVSKRTKDLSKTNKQLVNEITERKRIEKDLQRNENILNSTQKITKVGGWEWNVSNETMFWTDEVYRIHGFLPEEIRPGSKEHIEKSIECFKYEDRLVIQDVFNQCIQSGVPYDLEFSLTKVGGDNIWIRTIAEPVLEDGKVVKVIGNIMDITQIKRLNEKLRQSHKMESIGIMAGGVAHDFNNLLYMIVGNTELALEDIPEENPVYSNLEEIKSASLRAAGIVKQLLNFSRKTDQNLKPIGAVTIIKDALRFLRSTIPSTVELKLNLPDADIPIIGEPMQINQIMMNLCTNSSQVMQDTGGIIKIDVGTVILNEEDAKDYKNLSAGNHITIVVSDTGPGISVDILDRIFDPYFTTKEFGEGSGMGLTIVHGHVKNHNGAISVDSKPGEGATFNILIPVIDELPEIETETTDKIPKGHETILFVDDEESITDMTQKMLKRLGYKVEISLNPLQALDLFQSKPDSFDLVITDMTMPQMTGTKLAQKLKELQPDVPVIICTGHSSLIDEEKAKRLGIDGYVMKPASMSTIAKVIREILDK